MTAWRGFISVHRAFFSGWSDDGAVYTIAAVINPQALWLRRSGAGLAV
jgi:hypothetical protein